MSNNKEKSVLIVDDEIDNCRIWDLVLQDVPFNVQFAMSGETALENYITARAEGYPFSLLILDLAMPFINGFEVEEKIRHAGDDETPVIFFTAHHIKDEVYQRPSLKRAMDIWQKPMCPTEFRERVFAALGMKEGELIAN